MALRAALSLLLAALLSAGCISEPSESPQGPVGDEEPAGQSDEGASFAPPPEDPEQADEPTGQNAGTPVEHGTPQRTDGPVQVRAEGTQYVATRVVTVQNDFGGADQSRLVLSTFNGAIALQPSADGGYLFTAELHGRGATEQDARQALDLLELQSTDDLQGTRLELSFALVANPPAALPVPIVLPSGVTNGAWFQLAVPPEPAHDIEVGTDNGAIGSVGLHGPRLEAGTTNGAISADGAFDVTVVRTTNGAIGLGGGTFNDVTAQTDNGAIAVELDPLRTSAVQLTTDNGRISVQVPRGGDIAFDIQADTTNGEVTIAVEGHESEDDEHGEYRSPDWSSADIQLTLDLQTTNGSITVED